MVTSRIKYYMGPVLLVLAMTINLPQPSHARGERVGPVQVELVAEKTAIVPGQPFDLGLRILPDSNWHVYWKNPGDAGLPPALKWHLPDGFEVSDIQFAAPSLIPAGPLAAYGYYGEVLYPVTVTPPLDLTIGDTVRISLNANWLVCKEECLPGSAALDIGLPVVSDGMAEATEWSGLFENTRAKTPVSFPGEWDISAKVRPGKIDLQLLPDRQYSDFVRFEFFASEKAVIEYSAEQKLSMAQGEYVLEVEQSPYSTSDPDSISGVLKIVDGDLTEHYEVDIPVADSGVHLAVTEVGATSFALALALAFAGGIILNLMPCVLPVLSLKVLGLVEQARQSKKSLFFHGLAFSSGIVSTFWALVLVMFALQAGGAQLGWGFQLQSPAFVLVMTGFIFLMALNMFGVFEIRFLAQAGSVAAGGAKSGFLGAFMSGITATLLATPCTAPFMGTALGYSLTQPPLVSLMIYTSLGVGMAFPYLILTLFPAFLKFVPKPGRWIETLKQALGFLLIATVIWLAWVLTLQTGSVALVVLHVVLLLLAMAAWIYGRWSLASKAAASIGSRVVAAAILVISLAAGSIALDSSQIESTSAAHNDTGDSMWSEFSQEKLDSLLAADRSVFIDFTAAWCLSCQVNEQVVLSTNEVRGRFEALNVTLLKADWTRRSPQITRALARYGRNSVPLYVLYGPGQTEPTFLPEILTTGIVLEALDRIDTKSTIQ